MIYRHRQTGGGAYLRLKNVVSELLDGVVASGSGEEVLHHVDHLEP